MIEVNHWYLIPPLGLFFNLLTQHENFSTSHYCLSKSRGCCLALYWFLLAYENFEEKICSFVVVWILEDNKLICDSFEEKICSFVVAWILKDNKLLFPLKIIIIIIIYNTKKKKKKKLKKLKGKVGKLSIPK